MRHHTAVSPASHAAFLAILFFASVPAMARQTSPAAVTAPIVAVPPKNLFEALPNLRWDPALNGPLIIVVPQAATPTRPPKKPGEKEAPPLPPVPSLTSGVYRTSELLDYFGRRIVRLRGVTVFAPAQLVVVNTNLGKPDIYSSLYFQEKLQILAMTLQPGQWSLIGGPNGLGMGDLSLEQRDIFNALLPNPLVYTVTPPPASSRIEAGGDVPIKQEPPLKRTLTDAQRGSIRLRMNREAIFYSPSVDPSSLWDVGYISAIRKGRFLWRSANF